MTVHIREPSGYWEWHAAVNELAQEDGTLATAHSWAEHCVTWKEGVCRLRTPHVGVEELARRRRRDRTAIRRHLVALEELGLLELVQRHGHGRKRLYLARVPAAYGAPGDPQPLPGLGDMGYRAAAPGNSETLTGQQRPVIPGTSAPSNRAVAPGSPSSQSSQNSSRAAGSGYRAVAPGNPGQEEEPKPEDTSSDVLARLRAKVPAVMAQTDVATRARLSTRIRTLRGIGWEPDELVSELTRASFDGTRFPAGALLGRLDSLIEAGAGELHQLRAEVAALQAQRDQQQARRQSDDAHHDQERVEAERWTAELAAALPPEELTELLELVLAEHHPDLVGRGPAGMRHGTARSWLRQEYAEAGDGQPLAEFLAELRAKLDRADLDDAAVAQ